MKRIPLPDCPTDVNRFQWILRAAEQLRRQRQQAIAEQYQAMRRMNWAEVQEMYERAMARVRKT